jgi:hypothetical protein
MVWLFQVDLAAEDYLLICTTAFDEELRKRMAQQPMAGFALDRW